MITGELRGGGKPSLNEALGWIGSRVDDIYGAGVGRLEDVWIDPGTGAPRWLLVKEGRFGGRTTLIPFEDATAGAGHVWIPYEREIVREAPEVEPGSPLTQQIETALRQHYAANVAAAAARAGRGTAHSASPQPAMQAPPPIQHQAPVPSNPNAHYVSPYQQPPAIQQPQPAPRPPAGPPVATENVEGYTSPSPGAYPTQDPPQQPAPSQPAHQIYIRQASSPADPAPQPAPPLRPPSAPQRPPAPIQQSYRPPVPPSTSSPAASRPQAFRPPAVPQTRPSVEAYSATRPPSPTAAPPPSVPSAPKAPGTGPGETQPQPAGDRAQAPHIFPVSPPDQGGGQPEAESAPPASAPPKGAGQDQAPAPEARKLAPAPDPADPPVATSLLEMLQKPCRIELEIAGEIKLGGDLKSFRVLPLDQNDQ